MLNKTNKQTNKNSRLTKQKAGDLTWLVPCGFYGNRKKETTTAIPEAPTVSVSVHTSVCLSVSLSVCPVSYWPVGHI